MTHELGSGSVCVSVCVCVSVDREVGRQSLHTRVQGMGGNISAQIQNTKMSINRSKQGSMSLPTSPLISGWRSTCLHNGLCEVVSLSSKLTMLSRNRDLKTLW